MIGVEHMSQAASCKSQTAGKTVVWNLRHATWDMKYGGGDVSPLNGWGKI